MRTLTAPLVALFVVVAAALVGASPLLAGEIRTDAKAVVELFTSQGCSSCPPADSLLTELSQRHDIIALAFHVDYWDYLGWRDTFGSPANSARQRDYAAALGKNQVYTPQLVINGRKGVVGSRRNEVAAALADAALPVPVRLEQLSGMLRISVGPAAEAASVRAFGFKSTAEVALERGENAGRTLRYSQIVTHEKLLGQIGAEAEIFDLPLTSIPGLGGDGIAIIVQTGSSGPIVGAATYRR